jgi:hypothetical protein
LRSAVCTFPRVDLIEEFYDSTTYNLSTEYMLNSGEASPEALKVLLFLRMEYFKIFVIFCLKNI